MSLIIEEKKLRKLEGNQRIGSWRFSFLWIKSTVWNSKDI